MSRATLSPTRSRRATGLVAWSIVACLGATAGADVISFSPDGSSAPLSITAMNFAAGNAVAQNGDPIVKGSIVQLYFQASLGSVTLSNGQQFTPVGLNSVGGYQITVVASFTEVVTNVFTNPTTATFALASVQAPNSFFEMYYSPTVAANPSAGTGYNTGTRILLGSPTASMASSGNFTFSESSPGVPVIQPFNQSGTSTFPGVNTIVGSGSASVGSTVNQANLNHAFFTDPNPLKGLTFNAIDSTPFGGVSPSKLFADMPGGIPPGYTPNIGTLNGSTQGGGTDFQFQSQSNTSFFVPEPSTFALMGLGLLGLAGQGWRIRNRSRAREADAIVED